MKICKKCGKSLNQLLLLAMMMDCGAHVSPSPLDCKHEFEELKDTSETVITKNGEE
jgi:hypothetical protein